MAEALSVGGLASGLDTNAIIDGLTDLEQLRVTREVRKQIDVEDQKKAYEDLDNRSKGILRVILVITGLDFFMD